MQKKLNFGELSSETFNIGDIVEWTSWNTENSCWDSHYGIITSIKNKFKGGRLISACTVVPINGPKVELEFFTATLKLVSKTEDQNKN
jgi:hypothetical protein